jgi:hypothetical protein
MREDVLLRITVTVSVLDERGDNVPYDACFVDMRFSSHIGTIQ